MTWGSSVALWFLVQTPVITDPGGCSHPKAGLTRAHPALFILEPEWTVALSPGCPLDSLWDHRTCPHPGFTADG